MGQFKVSIQRKDQSLSREVDKESFTVGRSVECDISLNDNHISRVHLVVTRRWRQIWIEDKNSSNGTFINGTRIVQGTPVNVVASDRIQLGKSEYFLHIDVEAEENVQEPTMDLPAESEPEEPLIEETLAMPPPQFAQSPFQAEKLIHDAKRRAAQIILEGETQAEKRVQTIYQKARESQAQAELFYQTRLSEAHKEADAILADFQNQGRELLQSARHMSQELREEVDVYVQGLREKARQDAENLIAEATLNASKIKAEAMQMAREQADLEGRQLMEKSRDEVNRVLEFTRLQTQELQEKLQSGQAQLDEVNKTLFEKESRIRDATSEFTETRRLNEELQQEMASLRVNEESKLKAFVDAEASRMKNWAEAEEARIKNWIDVEESRTKEYVETEESRTKEYVASEEARIREWTANEESRIKDWVAQEEARTNEWTSSEEIRLKNLVQGEESKAQVLQGQQKDLEDQKQILERSVKGLQEQQIRLNMEIKDAEAKKDHLFKEFDSQKVFLNEKLEKEKSQMAKTEEQRLEEMRLDTAKRLKKMEHDLIEDVIRRKGELIREIHSVVEKDVVRYMQAAQWREISKDLENKMMEALEGKVATISQESVTVDQPKDVMKRRKQEKFQWAFSGVAVGLIAFFVAQVVIQQVSSDNTPMQTMVKREAQKRQEDLEKRKFNPPQAEELKDTYTDAVIYTRNFPELYADQEFQQKLYKSVSQYMYKTWRVEEEKSIQVLASSRALVKELQDRKLQIHPDFIKDGVQKMRDMELESLNRMKDILGTEVRVDSYRRFERNFYKDEMQRRRMASH